jgi:GDPmannose 4,6-dehydratase
LKRALVVGFSGQDGSFLVEQLRAKGYLVAGIGRSTIEGPLPDRKPIDVRDRCWVQEMLSYFRPDEIYYLAAFHHSAEELALNDRDLIQQSFEINTLALNNFLHSLATDIPCSRLFYAASSHVFGEPPENIQDELTPLNPIDAYGISKTAGLLLCRHYRRQKNIFCSVGILYNHESARRSRAFVSQKVISAAVRISRKIQKKLIIGDLDAMTDWGYAPDYVDAMWRILQLEKPEDFVIATGALYSVRQLVEVAFEALDLDWKAYVEVDPSLIRKTRTSILQGNSALLQARTGWRPQKSFREMIVEMVKTESARRSYDTMAHRGADEAGDSELVNFKLGESDC